DAALFDKTGTLTLGRPEALDLAVLTPAQASVALALAQASRHPLSEALRRSLTASGVVPAVLADVSETPGTGVAARLGGVAVALGRPEAVAAGLACALTIGDAPPVLLDFADALRPGAAAAVAELAVLGLPASILSGDSAAGVAPVAASLGLPAQAAMLPQDKLDVIAALTAQGKRVLMVGDGLNDGPALAAGYVSMAPASASDAGQNAADAVFLGDSLLPVATAVRVARATQAVVRQNFALAVAYNVIAVPLAIAGLVTPLIAALAMSGSSLLVIGNALRLRRSAETRLRRAARSQ
ncbi:MAG: HAD-IC family P-type ATPase, partial [Polymorphobacter sp.]